MQFVCCCRYGLPVNFQAMLVRPIKKNHKRMRDILNQLYGHLDSTALSGQQVSLFLVSHTHCLVKRSVFSHTHCVVNRSVCFLKGMLRLEYYHMQVFAGR